VLVLKLRSGTLGKGELLGSLLPPYRTLTGFLGILIGVHAEQLGHSLRKPEGLSHVMVTVVEVVLAVDHNCFPLLQQQLKAAGGCWVSPVAFEQELQGLGRGFLMLPPALLPPHARLVSAVPGSAVVLVQCLWISSRKHTSGLSITSWLKLPPSYLGGQNSVVVTSFGVFLPCFFNVYSSCIHINLVNVHVL